MIQVKKDFTQPPSALQSQAIKDAIADLLTNDNRDAIQSDLYRGKVVLADGSVKFEVVEALMSLYHDKCAYCEGKEFDPQVEHYRPKNKVIGAGKTHKGYFWLAFEWSNLVSTCFDCNKVGKGKGNRFPLIGGEAARITKAPLLPDNTLDYGKLNAGQPPLFAELPSLLHPEIDVPENYFLFDNQGFMNGTDNEGRGQATIKICNLNRRNLLYRRLRNLSNLAQVFRDAFLAFEATTFDSNAFLTFIKLAFNRIEALGNPSEEYSLFGKQVFERFPVMFAPLLPQAYQSTAIELFNRYKSGQL